MRQTHQKRSSLQLLLCLLSLITSSLFTGCGLTTNPLAGLRITPEAPEVRVGQSVALSAKSNIGPVLGGTWSVSGGSSAGVVSADGTYTAPAVVPSSPVVVTFFMSGQGVSAPVVVLNATPQLSAASPATLSALKNNVTFSGSGFCSNSTLLLNGTALTTKFIDSTHLSAQITVPLGSASKVGVVVQNPDPGGSTSSSLDVPINLQGLHIAAPTPYSRAGSSVQLAALLNNNPVTGGSWSVTGGTAGGAITQDGLYTAPSSPPSTPVTISYTLDGTQTSLQLSVENPLPAIDSSSPQVITLLGTSLSLTGTGFVPGSTVLVNGQTQPAQVLDSSHLSVTLQGLTAKDTQVTVAVQNPNPGAALSNSLSLPIQVSGMAVSPTALPVGDYTVQVSMPGLPAGSKLAVNGQLLNSTSVSDTQLSASGWIAPWITGTVPLQIIAADGTTVIAEAQEPIAPTAASFDAAARFSTQAGFGPRPDVVLHIQQVGLAPFLDEQFAAPVNDFHPATRAPVHALYLNATTGSSLLRLRTAWGFETFIPGSNINEINPVLVPWEQTLEKDAFGNYRDLLRDAMSDPNIGTKLNLAGNAASTDPSTHPNQNFGRELMQLFSLGLYKLNSDGSQQLAGDGTPNPSYSQDDILSMSRVFTGWNYAAPVNPLFTSFGIDYSQQLQPNDQLHDKGEKQLFGTITLPAGQTAVRDREAALDAIMKHPSMAPFISRILIQRFVTSQPSPEYIARISSVFLDNGQGVEGDLKSVIRAILLDPEARAGDSGDSSLLGFLQDPVYSQIFLMSVLQISGEDDQPNYVPSILGEGVFDPPTIFGYFLPAFVIPGTQINSPEYELYNNYNLVQRMQSIYGVATRTAPGYNNAYAGWLYEHFTTVPSMVEAVNHLIHHGTMSQAEQQAITDYCSKIQDPQAALETVVFLALNSENYTVIH